MIENKRNVCEREYMKSEELPDSPDLRNFPHINTGSLF